MKLTTTLTALILTVAMLSAATAVLAESCPQGDILVAQAPPPPGRRRPPPPPPGPGPGPGPGGGRAYALAQCTQEQNYCTQMCNNSYYGDYRTQCFLNCNAVYVACVNRANSMP